MTTQQPKLLFVTNLGDSHPLDHGGAFLFCDTTGVYPPELVIFEGFEDDKRGAKVSVSVIQCEKCTYENGVLSDNPFHPTHAAWYADKLDSVCSTCDVDKDEMISFLCSEDVGKRGLAYQTLVSYFGAYEFDQYPVEMTRTEIRKRWRGAFRK